MAVVLIVLCVSGAHSSSKKKRRHGNHEKYETHESDALRSRLIPLGKIVREIETLRGGRFLDARIFRRRGRFYYKIIYIDAKGKVKNIVIKAGRKREDRRGNEGNGYENDVHGNPNDKGRDDGDDHGHSGRGNGGDDDGGDGGNDDGGNDHGGDDGDHD